MRQVDPTGENRTKRPRKSRPSLSLRHLPARFALTASGPDIAEADGSRR